MNIRLDKYLADSGFGTRSNVKLLVRSGSVLVNNKIVKDAGIKINTETDEVIVKGEKVCFEEFEYYMLNKPAGVITATRDKNDRTVVELIKSSKRRDLFPVGRLDKDTEGLLLITNDGKLSYDLLSPGKHVAKRYLAHVTGELMEDAGEMFSEGLDIGDDKPTKPAKLVILSVSDKQISDEDGIRNVKEYVTEVEITEGRYHQVKRMFEAVGGKVDYLKRLSMASLVLDEALAPGEYRRLTDEEVAGLKSKT